MKTMRVSKKQQAIWDKRNQDRMNGHVANNLEKDKMQAVVTHSAYYDTRHGGPYDRGTADAWYRRSFDPHYYVGDTKASPRVEMAEMTAEEITAYTTGYRHGEEEGDHKEW